MIRFYPITPQIIDSFSDIAIALVPTRKYTCLRDRFITPSVVPLIQNETLILNSVVGGFEIGDCLHN
ncbi:MAG TPA: hypothetical protein V6C85_35630 [Allocoleopsis sp.]